MSAELKSKLKNPSLIQPHGYINGKWLDAEDNTVFAVIDPSTGEKLADYPDMTRGQVNSAVEVANSAFSAWAASGPYARQKLLADWHAGIMANVDDLATLVAMENGKPVPEAKMEVIYGASFLPWFGGEAIRTYGRTIPSPFPNTRNQVIKQPLGPAGLITPWNFPVAMITRKAGAALAAGCTVVIKAPAETPLSATALTYLAEKAGFPPGVINVVTMAKGPKEFDAGLELCESPLIKKLSFTGSTAVGRLLIKQSANTVKKLSLELGGNAAFIVFEDANVEAAAAAFIACKFRGAGQTCIVANRVFVHSKIYDHFASTFANLVKKMKVGNALEQGVVMGPLISQAGLEKVERHVQDALQNGASVIYGGKRMDGPEGTFFYEPTVITGVSASCAIQREETFGPIAALFKFESEDEVMASANDVEVGLAGYFFTQNTGRAIRVAEKLQTGMVAINTAVIAQAAIPFGGVKQSGFGREGGPTGIDEFMFDKLIVQAI